MKIAILTLPLDSNYGGNLQAYALYKTLTNMGGDVELINYRHIELSNFHKILSTIKQKLLFNKKIIYFFEKEKDEINRNHKNFINSYIVSSKAMYSTNELVDYFYKNKFNTIVVGSDQVWRFSYPPKIENFFLEFVENNENIRKIAYAASFGIDYWDYTDEVTEKVKNLVNKFNYISVREKSGVELCKNYLSVNAKYVVDPTLLLKREDYLNLIDIKKKTGGEAGILTYILDDSNFKSEIILSVEMKLNKKIFKVQPDRKMKECLFEKDLKSYIYPSIEDWIKSFYDASFIITDSFHGTVFAIIFNKPFISIVNRERGASRFESLLEVLELGDRMIDDNTIITNDLFENTIDYNKVNSLLDEWIAYSYNELKTALVDKE